MCNFRACVRHRPFVTPRAPTYLDPFITLDTPLPPRAPTCPHRIPLRTPARSNAPPHLDPLLPMRPAEKRPSMPPTPSSAVKFQKDMMYTMSSTFKKYDLTTSSESLAHRPGLRQHRRRGGGGVRGGRPGGQRDGRDLAVQVHLSVCLSGSLAPWLSGCLPPWLPGSLIGCPPTCLPTSVASSGSLPSWPSCHLASWPASLLARRPPHPQAARLASQGNPALVSPCAIRSLVLASF